MKQTSYVKLALEQHPMDPGKYVMRVEDLARFLRFATRDDYQGRLCFAEQRLPGKDVWEFAVHVTEDIEP